MSESGALEGKVALVTGGGRGLGRALALALANAGAAVCVAGRSPEPLAEVAEAIRAEGGRAAAAQADVTVEGDVDRAVQATLTELGRIDVLVNNSGVLVDSPVAAATLADWRHVIDTNLTGTFLCCRAVAPHLIEQRSGKVINVASMFAYRGVPRLASYAASKAAVVSLTASLALEWARFGIQVNGVAPGYFETDMNAQLRDDEASSTRILGRIPARRMGRPEELGPLVVYLASPASDFVTGQTVTIDGGQLAG
jgi:NAD(P)-dependent dehydrogenase (short-subunit alcohol dehydrogenase family)